MRMLTLLPLPAPRPSATAAITPRRPAPGPAQATAAPDVAEEEQAPGACGWFDSSHELLHGLQMTVHEGSAELATLVPLGWWLQWELEAAAQYPRR